MADLTPGTASAFFEGVAHRLETGARAVVEETLTDVLETAINHSRGPLSTADLVRMDHPYARRHGSPREEPDLINEQTGDFAERWDTDGPAMEGDTVTGSAFNTSDHARYLYDPEASEFPDGGTALAFGRPLPEAVMAACQPRFEERAQRHIEQSFKP